MAVKLLPYNRPGGEMVSEAGEVGEAVAAERDFPEVSMFRCDGLECHSDPYDSEFIRVECHFSESLRFRQVC